MTKPRVLDTRTEVSTFKSFFGDSVVTDTGKAGGMPLIVYRGEHGATTNGGLQTKLGTYSFSDSAKCADIYALEPNDDRDIAEQSRTVSAYLSIKNPIFNTNDAFLELGWLKEKLGQDEAVRIARKFEDAIEYTGNWMEDLDGHFTGFDSVSDFLDAHPEKVDLLFFVPYKYLDDMEEVGRLIEKGFDGAVHIGSGITGSDMEYRVFSLSQVRSAISMNLDGSSFADTDDNCNTNEEATSEQDRP